MGVLLFTMNPISSSCQEQAAWTHPRKHTSIKLDHMLTFSDHVLINVALDGIVKSYAV